MKLGETFEYRPPRGVQEYDPLARPIWYGLTTPPQKEKAAREYLLAQGLHAFFPDEKIIRTVRGKRRTIKKPMVSGYVFARFTGYPNWDVVRRLPFFTGVISVGDMPFPFPRGDIRRMMGLTITAQERRRAMRERQEAIRAAKMPVEGQKARLIDGPLKGFTVDITRVSGGVAQYILPGGLKGSSDVGALEREE